MTTPGLAVTQLVDSNLRCRNPVVYGENSLYPKAFVRMIILLMATVATALSAPITLELSGGSVIKGDLVSWSGQQAVVKAEFGSMTFRRDQLSQATIQKLELLSGDPQKLLARIAELEATVENLRKDNAALRQQLQTAAAAPAAALSREVPSRANSLTTSVPAPTGQSYTISSCGPADGIAILPNFQMLVVSRFREMGSSGPLSIQQLAIASNRPAEAAWSEPFKPSPATPPRGFSFAAIRHGKTVLMVYSVHFKSNRGEAATNIAKREEAARQLLTHVAEMERVYSGSAKVVTVIAGDFNTDPTDARFASEGTFALLREKFVWSREKVPVSERVTNPAKGRYPDACFDGFLVRGARNFSCKPIPIQGVSDHFPVMLTVAID
jgi:hypothetical protein